MFKYSKLTHKQFRQLLDCFVLGLPALQVAKHTGIHRNTVNRFFRRVRLKIAEEEYKDSDLLKGEIELDESYFGGRKKGPRGRSSLNKQIVFGILERKGKVHTVLVKDVTAATLMKEIKDHTEKGCVYYTDKFRSYNSLSRYGKHMKIDHAKEYVRNKHNHINGIEGFWSFVKRRLRKFNGVRKNTFLLYLKESEWRFNNRGVVKQSLTRLLRTYS